MTELEASIQKLEEEINKLSTYGRTDIIDVFNQLMRVLKKCLAVLHEKDK